MAEMGRGLSSYDPNSVYQGRADWEARERMDTSGMSLDDMLAEGRGGQGGSWTRYLFTTPEAGPVEGGSGGGLLQSGANTDPVNQVEGAFYDEHGYLVAPSGSIVPGAIEGGVQEVFYAPENLAAMDPNDERLQDIQYRDAAQHAAFMDAIEASGESVSPIALEPEPEPVVSTGGHGGLLGGGSTSTSTSGGGRLFGGSSSSTVTDPVVADSWRDDPANLQYVEAKPTIGALDPSDGLASWERDDWETQGLAEGGTVDSKDTDLIPDKGLTEFEEQLVQGAIQALSGGITDPAAVQEILEELERTFGEGAVAELQQEMQMQGGQAPEHGMDDSVQANLTPGELVVSNPQLADYGNGDREAGVKKLQQHLADVSKAHRGTAAAPNAVDPASLA